MGYRPEVARGFTLLELVVTLLVLAVAVAVVTPAIGRGTEAVRARAEVAGFAATLRHARERAISSQRPHTVVIDPEGHRMSVVVPVADGSAAEHEVRRSRVLSPRLTVETIEHPALEVRFDARGVASGGDFRLTSGGIVYRVTVDRLTGRVRSTRE
jgi:type II secretion system protein H